MRLILAGLAGAATFLVMSRPRRITLPSTRPMPLIAGGAVALVLAVALPPILATALIVAGTIGVASARRHFRLRWSAQTAQRWPDFLAVVRGRISAGDPLPDAVGAAARSLGSPFLDLNHAWSDSFAEHIETVRSDWADPVADRVLTTIRVAVLTGGAHVDAVLAALAESLADEIQLRRAHEAALTQQQLTAGVALVSPWVILLLSLGTNPQAAASFASNTGQSILALGAAASFVGYLLARRAARLSAPPRVFR